MYGGKKFYFNMRERERETERDRKKESKTGLRSFAKHFPTHSNYVLGIKSVREDGKREIFEMRLSSCFVTKNIG